MRYVIVQIDCEKRDCGKCKFVKKIEDRYKCILWDVSLNEQTTGSILRTQKCIDNESWKED